MNSRTDTYEYCAMNRRSTNDVPTTEIWKHDSSDISSTMTHTGRRLVYVGPSKAVTHTKQQNLKKRRPRNFRPISPPRPTALSSLFHALPIIEEEDSSSRWESLPSQASSAKRESKADTESKSDAETKDFTRRQQEPSPPSERKRCRPMLPLRQKSIESMDCGNR